MNGYNWEQLLMRRVARRRILALAGGAGAAGLLVACGGSSSGATVADAAPGDSPTVPRPAGWTDATHGKADPDYATVFPTNRVNQVTLTISAANWQAMLDDMTRLSGARGFGGGMGGRPQGAAPGGGGAPPAGGGLPPVQGGVPPMPGGGGGGGGGDFLSENPMWVPGTVSFNGTSWTNVGVRFKGNSTLRAAWQSGTDRMPFKLDFDEFEGDHPEIENQRFYGFKQLSLSNNTNDASFVRETIAYDLMEESGLAAAQTGFWELLLDRGEGPKSLGVYTAIEVIDDTVIARFFKEDSGNIYEADGPAASFAAANESAIEASFQVESDEAAADWSDIRALFSVLHSGERTSNAAAWRGKLEKVFDTDAFLNFLAVSAVIQHWDTYGAMTHNYYLYNDPATSKLTWISWDHNEVLRASGGAGGGAMGGRGNVSFDKKDVGANWPLIRYLLDQPAYYERYLGFLRKAVEGPLEPSKMERRVRVFEAVLAPAAQAQGVTNYAASMQSLIDVAKQRAQATKDFLATA